MIKGRDLTPEGNTVTGNFNLDIRIVHRAIAFVSKKADEFFTGFYNVYRFIAEFFVEAFSPPFEWKELITQCYKVGYKSLPLVSLTGFITGIVFTKQSRPALSEFGASSWLPSLISIAIIRALAPLVTALIAAGKVGEKGAQSHIHKNALAKIGIDGLIGNKIVIIYGGDITIPQT